MAVVIAPKDVTSRLLYSFPWELSNLLNTASVLQAS